MLMALFAYDFWKRIDELRGDTTLADLAEHTGMKNQTLRNQRSENRFPKNDDIRKLAEYLHTTEEYLLTGINDNTSKQEQNSDDMVLSFVRNNSKMYEIAKNLMENQDLLSAVSTIVKK